MLEDRAETAEGINREGKEDHITTEEVADKSVTRLAWPLDKF